MKISYVTPCKGRLEHLKVTYIQNIETALSEHVDVEFVLINYDCPNDLDSFVDRYLSQYLEKGICKYVKYQNLPIYSHSSAKNLAHINATGDVIINLDADNFIATGFTSLIKDKFKDENMVAGWFSGFHKGCGGRIAVRKDTFLELNGYNETLHGWGAEDFDMKLRLKLFSFLKHKKIIYFDDIYAIALQHSDDLRKKYTETFFSINLNNNLNFIKSLFFFIFNGYIANKSIGHINIKKYKGLKKWGWYIKNFKKWKKNFYTEDAVRILEIGSFDGISANMMLETIFVNKSSLVFTIDPFIPDITTPEVDSMTKKVFFENLKIGDNERRVKLFEENSFNFLLRYNSSILENEKFDFIYIDGSHFSYDILTDVILCWNVLKLKGVIVFDDYKWKLLKRNLRPKIAIEAFLDTFNSKIKLFYKDKQVFIRKLKN